MGLAQLIGRLFARLDDGRNVFDRDVRVRIPEDERTTISKGTLCLPNGYRFPHLYLGRRQNTIFGVSEDRQYVIKIEIYPHERKAHNLVEEAAIIKALNEKRCVSCPTLIEIGRVDASALAPVLEGSMDLGAQTTYSYLLQTFIPSAWEVRLADLLFSIVEQKNLGYYQGDVKPENLCFHEEEGVCYLVDYDQAERLTPETANLTTRAFLNWTFEVEEQKYHHSSWLRHFPEVSPNDVVRLLSPAGALNIAQTTLLQRQVTTNTPNGIYHTLRERDIYAEGVRDLDDRKKALDHIAFTKGEKVLDMGCNAGLLCHYLYDRGCVVTGYEMDASIVRAADMIAHITGRDIVFQCFDLDTEDIAEQFDTIVLFSVLHHTKHVVENARKVARRTRRILVECRLKEAGAKPADGIWKRTSHWEYENLEALVTGLETLFPGFRFVKNHGQGDRGRYVLEFIHVHRVNLG